MRVDELESLLRQAASHQPDVGDGWRGLLARRRSRQVRRAILAAGVMALIATLVVFAPLPSQRRSLVTTTGADTGPALCFPTLDPAATSAPSTARLPAAPDGPPLLALTRAGDIWLIAGGDIKRWTTASGTGPGSAVYLWAQWQPDGSILASRADQQAVHFDRLTGPGQASAGPSLPFTVNPNAPAGHCPIDGYLSSFAVGPDGVTLAKHQSGPIPHGCPLAAARAASSEPWLCESPEGTSFERRALDLQGQGDPLGWFIGGFAAIASRGATWSDLAVSTPRGIDVNLRGACCAEFPGSTVAALSADGSRIAYSPDGTSVWLADAAPQGGAAGATLWDAGEPVEALAWTGDQIVVAHGGHLTYLASSTAAVSTIAVDLGAIRALELLPPPSAPAR